MQRRGALKALATVAGSFQLAQDAHSAAECTPFMPNGVQRCQIGIRSSLLNATASGTQNLSQWCWAACIQMVFRYYGFRVSQRRIVEETWGSIVNLPGRPDQILDNLNRSWEDDSGRAFSSSGDSYSVNLSTVAEDLANDMPLIIGTLGHAVVLTSLDYIRDVYGRFQIGAAIVRDPWPGRGRRVLSPQEWYSISFAARIRVE
jgi:hypothetical protein